MHWLIIMVIHLLLVSSGVHKVPIVGEYNYTTERSQPPLFGEFLPLYWLPIGH